ncbi:MAG: hypothetical protein K2Y29_18000 [Beijerinckiaceae bacterium]|nr:hypothetical protein [Beijerinckiaceae bacterium]
MASLKIPYYVVKKGNGYWQPTPAMKAAGFGSVPCGRDGPEAWARAQMAQAQWEAYTAGLSKPTGLPKAGSLAEAFARYRGTEEWQKKAPRTREEWERCWRRIEPIFGDVRPSTVTLEHISAFRAVVAATVSQREAHRAIKIWRALWQVAASLKYCGKADDPSFGVRNTEPQPRQATWTDGEVVRLVKAAWRQGYRGLAAVMATGWDTQLSPVDLRSLTAAQRIRDAQGLAFLLARAKTGRSAIGTLTPRSEAIVNAYIAGLGVELLDNAPIFRNRSGRAYSKDTLGDDFRDIRAAVFGPGERRTLADFRRSGAVEAIRGGAKAEHLAAKMANDLDTSKALHKTYAPVDLSTARAVDEARRKGRRTGLK